MALCYTLVRSSMELIGPLIEILMSILRNHWVPPTPHGARRISHEGVTGMCRDELLYEKVRDKQMDNEREKGMKGTRGCFRLATEGESKSHRQNRRDIKLNSKSLAQQMQHSPFQQDFYEMSTRSAQLAQRMIPKRALKSSQKSFTMASVLLFI